MYKQIKTFEGNYLPRILNVNNSGGHNYFIFNKKFFIDKIKQPISIVNHNHIKFNNLLYLEKPLLELYFEKHVSYNLGIIKNMSIVNHYTLKDFIFKLYPNFSTDISNDLESQNDSLKHELFRKINVY